jgi:ATP-dependent DNA helicase RecG
VSRRGAPLALDTPLSAVRGIGPARAAALAAAGFARVADLVFHLPARYEDRRTIVPLGAATAGEATFRGRLRDLRRVRLRRRGLSLVRGVVADDSGELPVVWFNRPYLAGLSDEQDYLLNGRVRAGTHGLELLNPSCEAAAGAVHGGRVVPVYPAIGPLGPALLRRLLAAVVADLDLAAVVPEHLPEELRRRHALPPLGPALAALHAPAEDASAEALNAHSSPAHLRLIYGELFEFQLELALLRAREVAATQGFRYRVDDRVRAIARELLPFKLTAAQKRVLREIVDDLRRPTPMLRLLQGDVGSGKTIVAALALVVAAESGLQGAFMAPTELLAEQHYANLVRLLGGRYRVGLFTASSADLERSRRALAAGKIDVAVGTHALIQEGVAFRRLGLAVIDEQHRFGVVQRRLLEGKGDRPDVLVMTATPIPRSLALTAYGDLELSVLDELPPGRLPVATEVIPRGRRRAVYERLRGDLDAGGLAYVVLPLIEESEQVAAASLAREGEEVRRLLAPHPAAFLHGRVAAGERERVLRAFAAGELRALIATTVVEVGVDVPAATAMVIESGERFGLAQLHQLRGRVGRGDRPARCVVLHGPLTAEGRRRLEVFAATADGFALAEADLAIRGPGDLLGTRQAGLPTFRAADLVRDRDWLLRARVDARELLPRVGEPAFDALRARLERRLEARARAIGGG